MKMVNFVKARPLNARVFLGSDNVTLLQHTEVRWLSRGKVLACFFFNLRNELKVLFAEHNFHLSECLHDDEFLTRLGEVFSRLSLFNVQDKIEAMIKKLELFSVCINKDNTQVFPSLYGFLCANELKLIHLMPCLQSTHRYLNKRASI